MLSLVLVIYIMYQLSSLICLSVLSEMVTIPSNRIFTLIPRGDHMKRRIFFGCSTAAGIAGFAACSKDDEMAGNTSTRSEDGDLIEDVDSFHRSILTLDTHDDIQGQFIESGLDLGTETEGRQVDWVKMEKGGLDAQFFVAYTHQKVLSDETYEEAYRTALRYFDGIRRMCSERNPDKFELALTPDEVQRIVAEGKKVAIIGVENGFPIGEDLSRVEEFHSLGARYITLTHMGYNQLGDSGNENSEVPARTHGGLTELGRDVVAEMNRLGIMVDLSHVARDTFYDALILTKAPIICTHSGCRALCDTTRNLDDYQLQALAENGGVICLVAYKGYVKDPSEAATLSDYIDHIDHAVAVAGIDHVGIGADFDGGGGLPGFMDASDCINVTRELVKRGYSRTDIEKIWSGNVLRVWREVENKTMT